MTGYKTMIFNALMGIIALWKIYFPEQEMPGEVEVQAAVDVFWQIFAAVSVVGNGALRLITKTPVFKKS